MFREPAFKEIIDLQGGYVGHTKYVFIYAFLVVLSWLSWSPESIQNIDFHGDFILWKSQKLYGARTRD